MVKFFFTIGHKFYSGNSVVEIVVSISLMMLCGFLTTRITKKLKLPNVTAYIITGLLIGPFCLDLIPDDVVCGTAFLTDIALAFIAFSAGEFLKFSKLKANAGKMIVITLFETLLTFALTFVLCHLILKLGLPLALVLASLATATASASTMVTIRQTGAKGSFVDTILQVIAYDNIIALVAYSVAVDFGSKMGNHLNFLKIAEPILKNLAVLLLGGIFGLLMMLLVAPKRRSTDNRLIIAIALLFAFCGVCAVLEVSPLLGCMAMGMVYINVTNDDKLFKQLNYFSPPILLLFFVRSGITFQLDTLFKKGDMGLPLALIGFLYFIVRTIGKYLGAYLGCLAAKMPKKERKYFGLTLLPQAGVAIGLATLGARNLGSDLGPALMTIILAAGILYELIGPAAAKLALFLTKSYEENIPKDKQTSTCLQPAIHQENTEEAAFIEAAEEQLSALAEKKTKK